MPLAHKPCSWWLPAVGAKKNNLFLEDLYQSGIKRAE